MTIHSLGIRVKLQKSRIIAVTFQPEEDTAARHLLQVLQDNDFASKNIS
jgi:hypothetical protein